MGFVVFWLIGLPILITIPLSISQYLYVNNRDNACKGDTVYEKTWAEIRDVLIQQEKMRMEDVNKLQHEIKQLQSENKEIRNLLQNVTANRSTTQCPKENQIFTGFTLTFSPKIFSNTQDNLKIGRMVTNYSAIFTDQDEFVCCRDGVYVFFLHLVTNSSSNGAWIYKNNKPMTLVWQDGPPESEVERGISGTTSLVIDLKVGDKVHIRPYRDNLYVNSTSVWSGYLLSSNLTDYPVVSGTLQNTESGAIPPVETIIYQEGNLNYSENSENIVCTKEGLYKIDLHTIMNVFTTYQNGVQLRINANTRLFPWHSQNGYSSSSNMAIVKLNSGDIISFPMWRNHSFSLSNTSIFSVYFLSPSKHIQTGFSCNYPRIKDIFIICNHVSSEPAFNASGYIVAKRAGFYFFSVNIISLSMNNGIQIFKNENLLISAWLGNKWGTWQSATATVVVQLEIEDYITFRQIFSNLAMDDISTIIAYEIFI